MRLEGWSCHNQNGDVCRLLRPRNWNRPEGYTLWGSQLWPKQHVLERPPRGTAGPAHWLSWKQLGSTCCTPSPHFGEADRTHGFLTTSHVKAILHHVEAGCLVWKPRRMHKKSANLGTISSRPRHLAKLLEVCACVNCPCTEPGVRTKAMGQPQTPVHQSFQESPASTLTDGDSYHGHNKS